MTVNKTLTSMLARIEANQKRSLAKPQEVKVEGEVNLLPNWSESVRRVPNVALRSALFGAIGKGNRPYVEQMELMLSEVSVFYIQAHYLIRVI